MPERRELLTDPDFHDRDNHVQGAQDLLEWPARDVPPIEDLLKFLRRKADQAEEEEIPLTRHQSEKPKNKHQSSKQRGSVHVATPQTASHPPPYQAPQPATVQTTPPPQRGRGAQHKQKTAYPPCRYVCPLCTENHYAFSCSIFENYTVAQRKEHVRVNSLCTNCLKAGHSSADCRSDYRCKVCKGAHNTLLHDGGSTPAVQTVQGTANVMTPTLVPQQKSSLVMTSQVLLTGPTGKTLVARALLDSGSCLSIIST